MKTTNFKTIASLIMLTLFLAGCGGAPGNTESPDNIYGENEETATADYDNMFGDVQNTDDYDVAALVEMEPGLSTFAELLEQSEVSLEFAEPVTLFAPTNEAFDELPDGHLEHLRNPQNQADLVRFINRHVLPSERPLIQFNSTQIIETPMEEEIQVDVDMNGQVVYIGGAQIVRSDIQASNGIVHIVDGIVEPTEDVIPY